MRWFSKHPISAAILALSVLPALGQSGGLFPSGTVWGNSGASPAPPRSATITAMFNRTLCGTAGAFVQRTGSVWACATFSGDGTVAVGGAITVTKTNGVAFAASATTDTTNASNISSGALAAARGGAGTVNGVLSGNGSGLVTQGAASGLTNGVTGSGAVVLGTSATVTAPAVTGGTFTNLTSLSTAAATITGGSITGLSTPTVASEAATKGYVDSVAVGLNPLAPVVLATAAVLSGTPTYSVGGKTLTAGSNGALSVDSTLTTAGIRILVKDQTSTTGCGGGAAAGCQNGAYTVTTVGDGSNPYVLTRTTDYDVVGEIIKGTTFSVTSGTLNVGTTWVQTSVAPTTLGTEAISYVILFAGSTSVWSIAGPAISNNNAGTVNIVTSLTMGGNVLLNGNWLSGDGGNEGVFVSSSGNVGVNISTPTSKLDVHGTNNATDQVGTFRVQSLGTSKYLYMGYDAGDYSYLQSIQVGTAFKGLALNSLGGNVSINSAPSSTAQFSVTAANSAVEAAAFRYGTSGVPAVTSAGGTSGISSILYLNTQAAVNAATNVAVIGETHLSLGTNQMAIGGLFRTVNEGTWTPSVTDAGGVAMYATASTSRAGTLFGISGNANATTTIGANLRGAELDINCEAASCNSKIGLIVVSPPTDTGTTTGTRTIQGSGRTISDSIAIDVEATGGGVGFAYGISTITDAGNPAGVSNTLWISGGSTREYGLDWRDDNFNQAAILLGNEAPIKGLNAAKSLQLSVIKVNSSDRVDIGNGALQIFGSPTRVLNAGTYEGPLANNGAQIRAENGDRWSVDWLAPTMTFKINGTAVKTFVISHPNDPDKWLVHATTESPKAGVEYWGNAVVEGCGEREVVLPSYFSSLVYESEAAVLVTAKSSDKFLYASKVKGGKFTVKQNNRSYGCADVEFSWLVKAERRNAAFDAEPLKVGNARYGVGPYTWIEGRSDH